MLSSGGRVAGLRLDGGMVEIGGAEIGDLPRQRPLWRVEGIVEELHNLLPGQLVDLVAGGPSVHPRRHLGRGKPVTVGVGEEVVTRALIG